MNTRTGDHLSVDVCSETGKISKQRAASVRKTDRGLTHVSPADPGIRKRHVHIRATYARRDSTGAHAQSTANGNETARVPILT